uniref:Uncharacterized protein n=1 Tax=Ceratitis capitata TaxID=7213 RepID=W8B0M2_CERCA
MMMRVVMQLIDSIGGGLLIDDRSSGDGGRSGSGWMWSVMMWPPPSPGSGVRPDCRDIVGVVESARQRDSWGLGEGWNNYGYFERDSIKAVPYIFCKQNRNKCSIITARARCDPKCKIQFEQSKHRNTQQFQLM